MRLYCPLHSDVIKHNKCVLLLYFLTGFHLCLPLSKRRRTGSAVTFIAVLVRERACECNMAPFSLSLKSGFGCTHGVRKQQKKKIVMEAVMLTSHWVCC